MDMSASTNAETQQPALLLDSLPYVDFLNDELEQQALGLIEREMQSLPPPVLPPVPRVKCRSAIMNEEWEGMVKREGKELSRRPNFLQLSEALPPKKDTISGWSGAVQHARVEYEVERLRATALEATQGDHLRELWKNYNQDLEKSAQNLQEQLQQQRSKVNQIHLSRQQKQEKLGLRLQRLDRQRDELLGKKTQLRKATQELESELMNLRRDLNNEGGGAR